MRIFDVVLRSSLMWRPSGNVKRMDSDGLLGRQVLESRLFPSTFAASLRLPLGFRSI